MQERGAGKSDFFRLSLCMGVLGADWLRRFGESLRKPCKEKAAQNPQRGFQRGQNAVKWEKVLKIRSILPMPVPEGGIRDV